MEIERGYIQYKRVLCDDVGMIGELSEAFDLVEVSPERRIAGGVIYELWGHF
jgi:hypothetical protein